MKRRLLILPLLLLVLLVIGPSGVMAQCDHGSGGVAPVKSEDLCEASLRELDVIVPIVPPDNPRQPLTKNVIFVIDSSGSMDNYHRMGMAITFVTNILGANGDDLQCAVISFKSGHSRWPGVKHDGIGPPPRKGWAYFPGVPQLESAQKWLNSRGADGGTSPNSALVEALAERVRQLTVVIITDGEFDEVTFKEVIAKGQKLRKDKELGKALILVIGIGSGTENKKHLRTVGDNEGGGFYVVRPAKIVKPEPIDDIWPLPAVIPLLDPLNPSPLGPSK